MKNGTRWMIAAITTVTIVGVLAVVWLATDHGISGEHAVLFATTILAFLTPTIAAMLNLLSTGETKQEVKDVRSKVEKIPNGEK